MKPQSFIDKYLGQTVGYPDGQYIGECLSIVKLFIKEVYGIDPPPSGTNSAYGYWSNFPNPLGTVFEKIEDRKGIVPQPFDIMIWKPTASNSYGHIAIVKSADLSSTKFTSWDQNWNSKSFQETSHLYTNVQGWLHAKEVNTSDTIASLRAEIVDKNKQIQNYDAQVKGLIEDNKKKDAIIADLDEKLKEATTTSDGFRKQFGDFVAQLASKVSTRQETIEILAAIDTLITYEDKADVLDRKLALEVKEHQADVISFGKEIESLKTQLASLEINIKN